MHIPDGFLSPATVLASAALVLPAWAWAARGLAAQLDDSLIPRLAMVTALAYGLGLVMLPLPGGTSGHALGVALLALLFGWRLAFLACSGVLALHALLLGAGGLTALPMNALAMGLLGSASAITTYRLLRRLNETVAVAVAAWVSVQVAAALVALVLGAQPLIARRPDGAPLYFPFGWAVTLPAVLLPHALIGVAEAALTVLVWRHARARAWRPAAAAP
jgi:cobalt/nickel transport system permease protein